MLKEKMNNFIDNKILEYSEINSQKEPNLLKELNRETHLKILNPRMLSGAFQGRLLSLISKLINPEKILEKEKFIQHTGNALKIIPTINETFDLIFLDADKENYINYFNCIINKLNKKGVILADNVLWSGKVADEKQQDETTKILREFNNMVNNDCRVETILLPIRDGISLIRKI